MIQEIQIANLGVIDKTTLPLGPGFTALTGETGAGKTMLVTALGLLLGERADSGVVRSGSNLAFVDGRWQLSKESPLLAELAELGIEAEDDELILSRSISAEGRSKAAIGGRSVPVSLLNQLGQKLVTVHGQSEQLRLKSQTEQRQALDRFAGSKLAELLKDYQSRFHEWQKLATELNTLKAEIASRKAEAEELREALATFERLQPKPAEPEQLAELAEKLSNSEQLRLAAEQARQLLKAEDFIENPDSYTQVVEARKTLERVAAFDPQLNSAKELALEAENLLAELAVQLSSYLLSLEGNSAAELEQVEERRAELQQLARLYGGSYESALDYWATASDRLLALDQSDDRIKSLEEQVVTAETWLRQAASELHQIRTEAATELSAQVSEELAALAMPQAKLVVEVVELGELSSFGKDQVSFLLAPHPGSQPRQIAKGASGGELSRIMLAIEVVLAASDPVPTFVFDEVDAGVGGAAAIEIGRRLAKLAKHSQVIVVTHLAQVAAFASNHLQVAKVSDEFSTVSGVTRLQGEARLAEMARLLSGLADSSNALAHAQELLELANSAE